MLSAIADFGSWVGGLISQHEGVFTLALLAAVGTMPAELPAPFNRVAVLAWSWAWFHDGCKAFVSFRFPRQQAEGGKQS